MRIEADDYYVECGINGEEQFNQAIYAIYDKIIKYFIDHEAFSGETIMQDDDCIIDAPEVLADIADNIFKFRIVNKG